MSVIIKDPNEIQSYIESLTQQEHDKLKKLEEDKKSFSSIEENNNKTKENTTKPVSFMEIIHLTSSLLPGKKIFFRFIDSSLSQLQQRMKSVFKAPEKAQLAFSISDKKIAIRDNTDIYLFGYYYFSHKLQSIDIEIIDKIPQYKLNQQKQSKSFVYCKYGSNNYYVIITIDGIQTYEAFLKHLTTVFGDISNIIFIDSENERVVIESDDSYEYLCDETFEHSTKGVLLELLINQ